MRDQALVTAGTGKLVDDGPVRSRPVRPQHIDAERRVGRDPGPPHGGEQLRPRADAGAAVAEIACGALEDGHLPAGRPQEMGREQPADRAADHQCALPCQSRLPLPNSRDDDGRSAARQGAMQRANLLLSRD